MAMKENLTVSALVLATLISYNCAGVYGKANESVLKGISMMEAAAAEAPAATAEPAAEPAARELTDEELAAYYKDSVFVGDSIMLGFRNYCTKKKDSFVNGIQFLAVGNYSANNALKPVTKNSVHPLYKGKKYQLWEAVPLTEAKRMFILLGMNDIGILGLEGARDRYKEVIDKVKEACPDLEIHVISMTYTLKGKGKGKLNNKNIAEYNTLLQEMAAENGWGYMDVSTPISDGEGNLAAGSCSDGFVHLSRSAYDIWETVLRNYANVQPLPEESNDEATPAPGLPAETPSAKPAETPNPKPNN